MSSSVLAGAHSWRKALALYTTRSTLHLFWFGFSCGLPYMLVFATLSFWLREAQIERSSIGFFSWVMIVYGMKWLWSPLVDRVEVPLLTRWLGQRRSWIALAQMAITAALLWISTTDPHGAVTGFALAALAVALSSATQDIAVDAYRIEIAPQDAQGTLAAAYMFGYRLAMIVSGAGTLYLAAWYGDGDGYHLPGWQSAYATMALLMVVALLNTLSAPEPAIDTSKRHADQVHAAQWLEAHQQSGWRSRVLAWIYGAIVCPFTDFIRRYRWQAVLLLLLITCYRVSDIFMGVMANPFYVDIGYTKEQVASIAKVFGVVMTLVGTALGGLLVSRFGTRPILALGALLVVITNALFGLLAIQAAAILDSGCVATQSCAEMGLQSPSLTMLSAVISADNMSAGIATAAFIAFLSGLTNVAYSATQYALFSSLMVLVPKFVAGFSGTLVDHVGYSYFFLISALIGLPVLLLIFWVNTAVFGPQSPLADAESSSHDRIANHH